MKKIISVILFSGFLAGMIFAAHMYTEKGTPKSLETTYETASLIAYQIDEPDATTTYIRYEAGTGTVFIKKISAAGTVTTVEKVRALWTARTTATYIPINNEFE